MISAALDNVLARPYCLLFVIVEPDDNLASQDDGVVEAQCPVHWHREVARDVSDAKYNAAGGAPWDCRLVVPHRLLVVDRHRPAHVKHSK